MSQTESHLPSFQSCLDKQKALKELFKECTTRDEKYQTIIALGRALPPLPVSLKTSENSVAGCQSVMHLSTALEDGKLIFNADSEALISKGLAALLIHVYSGEPPEVILKCPPLFLEQLDISASLSPNRSNGLSHLFLRMKQEALKFLIKTEVTP